jgi:ribosomal protein S18 acetylase RimI-like enzyme
MRASHFPGCAHMAITVRPLTATDVPSVVPLFGAYVDFYGVTRNPSAEREFLEARLSAADSSGFGAFAGGEIAGFALCYHAYNSLRLAPAWILHDLFVGPEHRRKGIAEALIEAVHSCAKEAGVCEVILSTAHDNKNAQALYEKLGYKLDTQFRVYVRDLRS